MLGIDTASAYTATITIQIVCGLMYKYLKPKKLLIYGSATLFVNVL